MAGLKRELDVLAASALGVNAIIGSGIFFIPGRLTEMVGPAALVALGLAAFTAFAIALCFLEVGSCFQGTGGAFLYAQRAFGPFVGFFVGWIQWLARLATWAALANAFGLTLADLVGVPAQNLLIPCSVAALVTAVTVVNLRGVKGGAVASTAMTALKLASLAVFIGACVWVARAANLEPFAPHGWQRLGEGTLLIFYTFAGFEGLAVPTGEMKQPHKVLPLSMIITLSVVALVYSGVVAGTLALVPNPTTPETAVLDAAQAVWPVGGRTALAIALLVSLVGINSAMALITPRCLYAVAEAGMLPGWLARTGTRSQAPTAAIIVSAAVVVVLALSGTFTQLAALSVVGRFLQYIPTCFALFVVRWHPRLADTDAQPWRLPWGPWIALVAIGLATWIVGQATSDQWVQTAIATATGLPLLGWYLATRGRPTRSSG